MDQASAMLDGSSDASSTSASVHVTEAAGCDGRESPSRHNASHPFACSMLRMIPSDDATDPELARANAIMSLPAGEHTLRCAAAGQDIQPLHPEAVALQRVEAELRSRVQGVVRSLVVQHGFQAVAEDLACDAVVADLCGLPNGGLDIQGRINSVHADMFSNYMLWSSMMREHARVQTAVDGDDAASSRMLSDVALFTLIRMEAGCLRFCPEYLCWLYHRLREQQQPHGEVPNAFLRFTIQPMYDAVKAHAGRPVVSRANLDDVNEMFWDRACLGWSHTTRDSSRPFPGTQIPLKKTSFVERPSYLALFANFFPWWMFLAVHFHACLGVAQVIVRARGAGLPDLRRTSFSDLADSASLAALTYGAAHVLHSIVSLYHSVPGTWRSPSFLVKLGYAMAWCGAFFVLAFLPGWHGSALWWILIGLRIVLLLLANGVLHWAFRKSYVASSAENLLVALERVDVAVPLNAPLGGNLVRQPISSFLANAALWVVILGAKSAFDIHMIILQLRNSSTILAPSTGVPLAWGLIGTGYANVWIVILQWLQIAFLLLTDSYIVFSLLTPAVGAAVVAHDGVGRIRSVAAVLQRVEDGALAEAYTQKCVPSAAQLQAALREHLAAGGSGDSWMQTVQRIASPSYHFAAAWNTMLSAMRAEDLLSNADHRMLEFHVGQFDFEVRKPLILHRVTARATLRGGGSLEAVDEWWRSWVCMLEVALRLHDGLDSAIAHEAILALDNLSATAVQQRMASLDPASREQVLDSTQSVATLLLDATRRQSPTAAPSMAAALVHSLQCMGQLCQEHASAFSTCAASLQPHIGAAVAHVQERIAARQWRQVHGTACVAAWRVIALMAPAPLSLSLCPEAKRRIVFFSNSMLMPQLQPAPSCLQLPTFTPLTPHYAEAVLYDAAFLQSVNEHGVAPLDYIRALHAQEWENFVERLQSESGPIFSPLDSVQVRLWASMRGQTLARTVIGISEYAEALRHLAASEFLLTQLRHAVMMRKSGVPAPSIPSTMLCAAVSADWLVSRKFAYYVCAQRYGDATRDDVARRGDIDFLLQRHPLLRVVWFQSEAAEAPGTASAVASCCKQPLRWSTPRRVMLPGHPIVDGICEGKPANQDNAAPFPQGTLIQVIDMNQAFSWEEALKLSTVITREFLTYRGAYGRPTAMVGAREHVFSSTASTPALLMSYQELQFGIVWQRIMSTLQVRLHYGHPDFVNRMFMGTRGGFSKASKVLNVSEDVFAGMTAMLRGGLSRHVEYIQFGKGRDVGMLQIAQFEAKVSGGSAISMTTRDACRVVHNLEFFRMLSLFHSWAGYYLFNVTVVAATVAYIWYLALLGISGAATTLIDTRNTEVVNPSSVALFLVQIGIVWYLPLLAVLWLEYGGRQAVWRLVHLGASFGPMFYVAEMLTKAYYFDSAISFGAQAYLATGRSFVIRHVPFDEIYRSVAHSHVYVGFECLLLLLLWHVFGAWGGVAAYVFTVAGAWIFTLSVLLCFFWFNPFALHSSCLIADVRTWLQWLGTGYTEWFHKSCAPYARAPLRTKLYHTVRLLRWLVLAAAMAFRAPVTRSSSIPGLAQGLTAVAWLIVCIGCITSLQFASEARERPGVRRRLIIGIVALINLLVVVASIVIASIFADMRVSDGFLLLVAYGAGLWLAARICVVWNVALAGAGHLALAFDALLGALLLGAATLISTLLPLGSYIHNAMLFTPGYAASLDALLRGGNERKPEARRE